MGLIQIKIITFKCFKLTLRRGRWLYKALEGLEGKKINLIFPPLPLFAL